MKVGPGVGDAPKGRSATRAYYLGLIGQMPRANARASQPRLPSAASHTTREEGPVSYTFVYWAIYESILCSRDQYREERPRILPGNTEINFF